jgi:hypothetical protein
LTLGIDPERPVTITMRRVTAVPGALWTNEGDTAVGNVPADELLLERIYVESGTLEVIGLPAADGSTPQAGVSTLVEGGQYGSGGFVAVNLDTPPDDLQQRNVGEGPLVATVLTIRYVQP